MTEPFTVQAGKRYNRRDGSISGVLKSKESKTHPFYDGEWHYTAEGCLYSDGGHQGENLVSEYKKPYSSPKPKRQGWSGPEPTAEPQDEFGDWIGWNGGNSFSVAKQMVKVLYASGVKNTLKSDVVAWGHVAAYRIKKEPVVVVIEGYIGFDNLFYSGKVDEGQGIRKAIITLTDGKPSIEWADDET